jgi:D-alanyl-D-alanine carboxypeptidase
MLPSGNDAALCLAKWGGNLIREEKEPKIKKFVERMNKEARKL